jgi:hypothetical protein
MIVLYNVADKLKGSETKVTQLTERSDYSTLTPIAVSKTHPADLVAAQYSVAIAGAAGGDRYASSLYSTAQQKPDDNASNLFVKAAYQGGTGEDQFSNQISGDPLRSVE